jgi:hypothetical protein
VRSIAWLSGFLVHREHQGVLRRVQAQADHVADLVHELRIRRELPGLDRVRLEPEGAPDPVRNEKVPSDLGRSALSKVQIAHHGRPLAR